MQFVDRSAGKGPDQVVHHGRVACLDVMGSAAKIAGSWVDGGSFNIWVEDTGEGHGNEDVVTVMDGDPMCDFEEPDDEDKTALARGNAQVRDAG